mgnify:CR=1 FL=1
MEAFGRYIVEAFGRYIVEAFGRYIVVAFGGYSAEVLVRCVVAPSVVYIVQRLRLARIDVLDW